MIFNLRQVFAPFPFALTVTEAPIISQTAYGACFDDGSLFNIAPAAFNRTSTDRSLALSR